MRHVFRRRRYAALGFALAVATTLKPLPSVADGAIAVGIPAGGVAKGFAVGTTTDAADTQGARTQAMNNCQNGKNAPDAAKKACGVVASFKDQCFSLATDPKDGTPGAGWAVADTVDAADKQALQQCRNTAGPRAGFCNVANRGCDGAARLPRVPATAVAPSAVAQTIAAFGLIGNWATDCSKPTSEDNYLTVYAIKSSGEVWRTYYNNPGHVFNNYNIVSAEHLAADLLAYTQVWDVEGGKPAVASGDRINVVLHMGDGKFQIVSSQASDGSYFVKEGKFPSTGKESPWQQKCPTDGR